MQPSNSCSCQSLCVHLTNNGYAPQEGGGGSPTYKGRGCSLEILKRIFEMYQNPDLWAWLELSLPLKGTSSKTTHSPVTFIFNSISSKVLQKLPL